MDQLLHDYTKIMLQRGRKFFLIYQSYQKLQSIEQNLLPLSTFFIYIELFYQLNSKILKKKIK